MSILDTLITDRIPGAAYGWQDMNRVAEAMEYVADRLNAAGWSVTVEPHRFTREDFPTETIFAHYLEQLRKLQEILPEAITTQPLPGVSASRPYLTVQEANDIEKILLDVEAMVRNAEASYYYSGEIYGGEH